VAAGIQARHGSCHRQRVESFRVVGVALEATQPGGGELGLEGCVVRFAINIEGRGVSMNLQPLGDRLIVEVLEEDLMTVSGIVLPDTAREKPQRGRVLVVGPGERNEKGDLNPMGVEVDDEIIFSKYGGTEIKVGADELLILRETDVLAKVVGTKAKAKAKGKGEPELAGATS
jgi:chaperonin GroES